jgi:hypothetical protein
MLAIDVLEWPGMNQAFLFSFGTWFLAFGIVPHQWIDHADKELGWRKDKLLFGPGDIFKSEAQGGSFPFDISYEALRDIIVVVIHAIFIGLMVWIFVWWQKRGKDEQKQIETSTYGRPLVRKA